MNDELMDMPKMIADKRMERAIEGLLSEDTAYRKLSKSACSAERIYNALNLNPDIKIMIDQLPAERGGINMEKASLAYWTEMMDTIIILRNMDIIILA